MPNSIWRSLKYSPVSFPLWKLLSYPIGFCFFFWTFLKEKTSKITVTGPGLLFVGPAIYIHWHQHIPHLISQHGKAHRWMLVSGAPYMEPIVRWSIYAGMTNMIRGATGENATNAVQALSQLLLKGESIVLAVDGPAGPAFKTKRGCVELAKTTGCPMIPISYSCKYGKPNPKRWDLSLFAAFFDEITIVYGSPIYTNENETIGDCLQLVDKTLRTTL